MVIDFGTATTYDMVDENGTFMGGITAPGIRISAKALWEDAAKLAEIEIKKPDNILGIRTNTIRMFLAVRTPAQSIETICFGEFPFLSA